MGFSIASIGMLFGFISLLMGQVMNDSRSAYFTSYGLYAVLYICRMLTDVSNPKWTWVSPVGWVEKTAIYSQNYWLPLVLILGLGMICLFIAITIASARDIGSGILSTKEGKAKAGHLLSSPIGLVFKLERNSIFGWLFGSIILGTAYGSIFQTIGDIIGTNPTYKKLLGISQIHTANRELLLNYLNMLGLFFVALAVTSGILVVFRLSSDENKGYLEMVHAKKISKTNLAASYFLVALCLSLFVFTSALVSTFLIGNSTLNEPLSSNYFWQTFFGFLPTILFYIGCANALVGFIPKANKLLWFYLAAGIVFKMFGPLMNLPKKYAAISPFGWVGKIPSEPINQQVTLLLWIAFIILTILGLVGYNKRDME
ncbi:ABC transporter permease [Enterococcus sp. 22-H-5-01]|uniref:ABC transporter permease n=1 Tax=Enterococcus sp. 22-H-5-01 TaxID=3418555 RepID=UPI003D078FC9